MPKTLQAVSLSYSYTYYQDPGHGWLMVPRKELFDLGIAGEISQCSYQRNGYVYLEEDEDLAKFIRAIDEHPSLDVSQVEVDEVYQERTPIRRMQRFTLTAAEKERIA